MTCGYPDQAGRKRHLYAARQGKSEFPMATGESGEAPEDAVQNTLRPIASRLPRDDAQPGAVCPASASATLG